MKYTGVNELRQMFQDFWVSKDHYPRGSFSLVPEKDKSLLLINSGMAPLKPFFSGAETPPKKRMTTCQKCIRTGDIDNVGHTARHATFFEMMGNFSFGDYFKKEAILWGYEFITKVLELPEDRIWATIYEDDDEAHDLWRELVDMPEERIVRLGKDDNFWEIGTGPCGPCSEVYYDRGEEFGCGKPDCKPGCDCDRYLEFWNFVFTQFDRQEDGTYVPLEHPNIDTGMGLERMACILQNVDSIYAIDTMRAILDEVVRITGVKYMDGSAPSDVSIRVITDHVRTVCFMIADGILPSNEGRGYVLRRLLRRAARHGRILGLKGPFLAKLAEKVVETSGGAYKELVERKDYIQKIISIEEAKFASTIEQGSDIIDEYIKELKSQGKTQLSGQQVFKLYDTFGFPLELTKEIAEESGCTVDEQGFAENMQAQKDMARAARKSEDTEGWSDEAALYHQFQATEFLGYETLKADSSVLGIFKGSSSLKSAGEGEDVIIVLDKTPFYAEGGGQTGDKGTLEADGLLGRVTDTLKSKDVFLHKVHVESGEIAVGDVVTASVCPVERNSTARNHTATHLLHKALRMVLGDHVDQAGSLVTKDALRFDFTHFEGISKESLDEIEEIVNKEILTFADVKTEVLPIDEAKKRGATALFGEKYGSTVRVVSVPDFSMELCGGTHVANIGQIGSFKIISESGVAAGVRRIEAVTGYGVSALLKKEQGLISKTCEALKTNTVGLVARAEAITEETKALKKELEALKLQTMGQGMDDMLKHAKSIDGARLITNTFEGSTINDLRTLSDEIMAKEKGVVLVFAAVNDDKATLMVSVANDLLEKGYHAGNMIKEIAKAAGGGGGGKADMAQAGAKDISKLGDAFAKAEELMKRS